MLQKIKYLIPFLIFATTVNAAEFIRIKPSFFQRVTSEIKRCQFDIPCYFRSQLGTAFSTITGSNLIKSFPTTYNANLNLTANTTTPNSFSGLQQFNGKASSTQISATTAYFGGTGTSTFSATGALSLAGALTLTTPLTVANGGTGSTTLSTGQVLVGSTTNAVTTPLNGWGSSGQFLTSQGSGLPPQWTTSSLDQTANYSWTGNHNFTGTTSIKNLNASSTAANPMVLNGVSLNTPSTQGASSTVWINDGNGKVAWQFQDWRVLGEQILTSPSGTTTVTIPSGIQEIRFTFDGQTTSDQPALLFNGEGHSNTTYYSHRSFKNYTAFQTSGSAGFGRFSNTSTSTDQHIIGEIMNNASSTSAKIVTWTQINNQGVLPEIYTGMTRWANPSARITILSIETDGNPSTVWDTGTRLTVYGR